MAMPSSLPRILWACLESLNLKIAFRDTSNQWAFIIIMLPSRELTYPTLDQRTSSSTVPLAGDMRGYVSSQEGIIIIIIMIISIIITIIIIIIIKIKPYVCCMCFFRAFFSVLWAIVIIILWLSFLLLFILAALPVPVTFATSTTSRCPNFSVKLVDNNRDAVK